jgi:hypothetical protein
MKTVIYPVAGIANMRDIGKGKYPYLHEHKLDNSGFAQALFKVVR